jgi:peptidoglycan/LPS O-acetylase OafA/YrhL
MIKKYRPDIDGLRAIAVIAVIIFHAFPNMLPGGFVGVDIFFVISGYLITTIIHHEISKNDFKFIKFYSRRIRRLFPALLILLSINILLGWYVLFPDEFKLLGKHILSANLFISNFTYSQEFGYFDTVTEKKPLLHLWSLGVEEQYYIMWPLIILLTKKLNLKIIWSIIAIFTISQFFNLYYLYHTKQYTNAFYLPYGRFWELMAGSSLALIPLKHITKKLSKYWIEVISTIATVILLGSFFIINENMLFPGWIAIFPILASVVFIISERSYFNRYILSNQLLVYIGLISYPLYLYHWSLISYQHILYFDSSKYTFIGLILSAIISFVVYRFVERKVRYKKSPVVTPALIIVTLIISIIAYKMMNGTLSPRNNSDDVKIVMSAIKDWAYPKGLSPVKVDNIALREKKSNNKKTVLFYGDSHIEQYAPRIIKLINSNPKKFKSAIFATRGGVPPFSNVFEQKHPAGSTEFKRAVEKLALSPNIDSVVLGWSYGYLKKGQKNGKYRYYVLNGNKKIYCDEADCVDYALESLKVLINKFLSADKKVYILIDNPKGKEFDPKYILQKKRLASKIFNAPYSVPYNKTSWHNRMRKKIVKIAKETGVAVIDTINFFCPNGLCRVALDDGTPIYKDSGHMRPFYARDYIYFFDDLMLNDKSQQGATFRRKKSSLSFKEIKMQ